MIIINRIRQYFCKHTVKGQPGYLYDKHVQKVDVQMCMKCLKIFKLTKETNA